MNNFFMYFAIVCYCLIMIITVHAVFLDPSANEVTKHVKGNRDCEETSQRFFDMLEKSDARLLKFLTDNEVMVTCKKIEPNKPCECRVEFPKDKK